MKMSSSLRPVLKACAALAALATVVTAVPAGAHVTLEQTVAPAGSYQKLTFRVGHGCDGAATSALTVMLPEAVTGAKPMPKPGWKIALAEGPLAQPVASHGKTVATTVREISWSGGPLPDAYFDEFVMQVKLPEQPGKQYFKVVQTCGKVSVAWDEIGNDTGAKLKAPAPVLEVLPAGAPAHQH